MILQRINRKMRDPAKKKKVQGWLRSSEAEVQFKSVRGIELACVQRQSELEYEFPSSNST
jgi:hypothetical protein